MRIFFIKLILMFCLVFSAFPVLAQDDKIALTISPPLIKNNINRGESWGSFVKVVNNNKENISVYTYVFDFKSGPEGGVEFLQDNFEEDDDADSESPFLLSKWIEITKEPILLKAHESKEIPFVIKVPEGAEPGGHYAAILVGTKPNGSLDGSGLNVSSLLSSLIMVKVGGEIIEKSDIREFSVSKNIYSEPKVDFMVRFENLGNVHVQPRGEIKVYDFWGKEKGSVPINHNSGFGHVLPGSVRSWDFSWEGEKKVLEMGRYRASLILSYGEDGAKTVYYNLNFWIIYWKFLISFILGVSLFIFTIVLLIKSSVSRAVRSAQKSIGIEMPPGKIKTFIEKEKEVAKNKLIKKKKINNDKVVDLRELNK